jgi:hypothetical protein
MKNVFILQFTIFHLNNKNEATILQLVGKTSESICELKGKYDIILQKCKVLC